MAEIKEMLAGFAEVANNPKAQLDKYLAEGKRVIGVGPYHVPEELVHAAGAVPFGVWGAIGSSDNAKKYFPPFYCSICQMTLEMGMTGKLNGLSGMMITGLCDTLRAVQAGTVTRTPQDNEKATYAPMLTKALCPIDWTRSMRQIVDQVRGLDPWPVATAELGGTHFKIYSVRPTDKPTDKQPGTPVALTKRALEVACGNGVLEILELQADGGKRMRAPDYFRGHPIVL